MNNLLNLLINLFKGFLTSLLFLTVILLIFTTFPPIKTFKIYRVNSGSMEPVVKIGSIVVVQKINHEFLKEKDIITFNFSSDENLTVTHRIAEVVIKDGKKIFRTKGDANKAEDAMEISPEKIKGKVIFSIPFLGYLSLWVRKPLGFILLVILPALLLIINEVINIKKIITEEIKKKTEESSKTLTSSLLIIISFTVGFLLVKSTSAYFTSLIISTGNTLTMGYWITPTVEPTPTSSITPTPQPGEIVINEIMWMGSQGNAADEWIELRNMTNHPIDLSNCTITNLGSGEYNDITIPSGKQIEANGFFLISNNTKQNSIIDVDPDFQIARISLRNTGEQLILKNASNTIIDIANGTGNWFAGEDNPEKSMERNDYPGDGTQAFNWHTATARSNLDPARNELATPRAANSLP